jgi:anti-sigma factor RsiW
MVCETWTEKLDAYLDGELPPAEAKALGDHLRGCPACAAESLARVQQKRALQSAGQRFTADPAFRARIQNSIAARPSARWSRFLLPTLATAMAVAIVGALAITLNHGTRGQERLLGEVADLHIATLASANPVDVVSTDRHTVKPWFGGKIPFTFNLPELQNSPFTLLGAKVSYLNQSPGAELLFRVRQHQISVFIFQERALGSLRVDDAAQSALSFNVRTWSHNGLRYFVIGDASPQDLDQLSDLIKAAG